MSRYVKSVFGFALLAIISLYGCQPNSVVPKLPPDYVALRSGESAFTKAGLLVVADTLSAFICPFNASCSTPDRIVVSLQLVRGKDVRPVQLLALIDEYNYQRFAITRSDSTGIQFGKRLYKVVLRGPQTKNLYSPNPQAIIQVSRL